MNRNLSSRRPGRSFWLALVAVVAVVAGLLVPIAPATADVVFAKPTGVRASAISGSNGITVTWTAPATGGVKPVAYKVSYGTSSSLAKSTTLYVAMNRAYLSSLTAKKYYYVWVEPWTAANRGVSAGARSSAVRAKTSKFSYKAPNAIHAVNATKTTMEVTWQTVTGSPGYVLRGVGGGQTKYQVGFDGSAIFTGLKPSTSYKFTVANRLPLEGYTVVPGVRMSNFSSKSATKATNPATMMDAPTNLTMTNRDSSSVTFTWDPPAGYDAATDKVRAFWAEDQEMTDHAGYTKTNLAGAGGRVGGLRSNTNFFVRIQVVRESVVNGATVVSPVSDRSGYVMVKTRSPKGFAAGTVSGLPGSVLNDYVAVAYSVNTKDISGQANVSSAGAYRLELRPGNYYIQLAYVGSGNYTTVWVTANGTPAYTRATSGAVTVALDKTVTVHSMAVGGGAIVSGIVKVGGPIRDVYISARTSAGSHEVVAQDTTSSAGAYTLQGLPPSTSVIIRVNSATGAYRTKDAGTITTPSAGGSRDYDVTMSPA